MKRGKKKLSQQNSEYLPSTVINAAACLLITWLTEQRSETAIAQTSSGPKTTAEATAKDDHSAQ